MPRNDELLWVIVIFLRDEAGGSCLLKVQQIKTVLFRFINEKRSSINQYTLPLELSHFNDDVASVHVEVVHPQQPQHSSMDVSPLGILLDCHRLLLLDKSEMRIVLIVADNQVHL